jgi:hypothetical protein
MTPRGSKNEVTPRAKAVEQNLPLWTRELLGVLTTQERDAFVLSQTGMTQQEIGDVLEISGGRASQLVKASVEKMTEAARRGVALAHRVPAVEPHPLPTCRAAGRCQVPASMKGALDLSVALLILGLRGTQCLEGAGITYVGHLVARTDFDLLRISYLGRKTLKDIKAAVAALGLHLGMDVGDWRAPQAGGYCSGGDDRARGVAGEDVEGSGFLR